MKNEQKMHIMKIEPGTQNTFHKDLERFVDSILSDIPGPTFHFWKEEEKKINSNCDKNYKITGKDIYTVCFVPQGSFSRTFEYLAAILNRTLSVQEVRQEILNELGIAGREEK